MTAQFPSKLYNHLHLLLLLFTAWLTYCSCQVGSSKFNNSSILCVESERVALLHFKLGIRVDHCRILDDWGHSKECCQWHGIRCNIQSGHVIGLNLSGFIAGYGYEFCLEGTLSVSLLHLKHLKYLDLSYINFTEASLPKFIGSLHSLERLHLSSAGLEGVGLEGVIPQEIGNLSSLTSLNLSGNSNWRVDSLSWLSRLRLLRELDLSNIDLSPTTNIWLSIVNNLPFLRELRLNGCSLSLTSPPSLSYINSSTTLVVLDLSHNNLNDTPIFEWLFNLSGLENSLTYLDLSYNKMFGSNLQLSESSMKLLDNLCSLRTLDLSYTNLNYKFSDIIQSFSKCPHKALLSLHLTGNQVWGSIPDNIGAFSSLRELGVAGNQLNGTIPISFWNSSLWSGISILDMSFNMITGTIPDVSIVSDHHTHIDLSYNILEGVIPSFLRNNVSSLHLNNNKFSKGLFPFLCPHTQTPLSSLDLSSNLFSEKLPDCWGYFDQLKSLHLENNSLWGSLPTSMGALNLLFGLHLSNNNLSGSLPASLVNCKSLVFLDLANNSLTGHIPPGFGHSFAYLASLSLQSNRFVGVLPTSFCELSYLRILDLSNNYISGTIPSCLYKLVSMTNLPEELDVMLDKYEERVMWKRYERTFSGLYKSFGADTFDLLKGIDISNNKLEGHIPEGISSLVGLKFLNLSRNNLTGVIMSRIGQLTSLESLDLSHNHLSGEIPPSLTQISCLATFDISDNNLTGKIPIGTQLQSFDASSYMRNPGLSGAPLPKCVGDEAPPSAPIRDGEQVREDDFILGLCISVVLGFIIGFWGVCGTLQLV